MATNDQLDDRISLWLEARAPAAFPGPVLDDTFDRTRRSPQQVGWRAVAWRPRVVRPALAVGGVIAVVIGTMVAVNLLVDQPRVGGPAPLPATPEAWSRVRIETPSGTGTVFSIAASANGLLAVVGEQDGDGPTRLAVSPDGLDWRLVPDDQNPRPWPWSLLGGPNVLGTDRGFLLTSGTEVWSSEHGDEWRRINDPASDPDLALKRIDGLAVGGPGLVAVGGDTAWSSVDGSDWSRAVVPSGAPGAARIATAGDRLVAWGITEEPVDGEPVFGSVLWVSEDGRTWTDESDPRMGVLTAIVGGPNGFVAIGGDQDETPALWWSVDGTEWEQIGSDAFDSRWTRGSDEDSVDVTVTSGSATSTGYVLVGTDRLCLGGLCRRNGLEYADLAKDVSSDAVVWTSPDGRSWSRLANDGRFGPGEAEVPARASGAEAGPVAAWGSRFVVGGKVDDGPVVWISSPEVAP